MSCVWESERVSACVCEWVSMQECIASDGTKKGLLWKQRGVVIQLVNKAKLCKKLLVVRWASKCCQVRITVSRAVGLSLCLGAGGGASVAQRYRTGLLVNRSSHRSCTWGMIHNKIHHKLKLSTAQYSLIVRNRGLHLHSFHLYLKSSDYSQFIIFQTLYTVFWVQ